MRGTQTRSAQVSRLCGSGHGRRAILTGLTAFQLATVDTQGIPHVRTHVYHGFLFPKGALHAPILVTSTDVRAPKVAQILSNSNVELVWWMEGSMEQFRIAGRALVVPAPKHNLQLIAHARLAMWFESGLKALREHGEQGGDGGEYDFERKRQDEFDAMPSALKAEWARHIAPGVVVDSLDVLDQCSCNILKRDEINTDEDKQRWEAALENFVMVLVEPTRVDWVQLGVLPIRRTVFTRTANAARGWTETFVVP